MVEVHYISGHPKLIAFAQLYKKSGLIIILLSDRYRDDATTTNLIVRDVLKRMGQK